LSKYFVLFMKYKCREVEDFIFYFTQVRVKVPQFNNTQESRKNEKIYSSTVTKVFVIRLVTFHHCIDVPFTEERLGDELLHLKVNSCFNCSEGFYHTKQLLHCCPQHSGMYLFINIIILY